MRKLKLKGREMLSREQLKKIVGGTETFDEAKCCEPNSTRWCYSTPVSWAVVVGDIKSHNCPDECGAGHPYGNAPWPGSPC